MPGEPAGGESADDRDRASHGPVRPPDEPRGDHAGDHEEDQVDGGESQQEGPVMTRQQGKGSNQADPTARNQNEGERNGQCRTAQAVTEPSPDGDYAATGATKFRLESGRWSHW
jgi:hypothetical protein